MAYNTKIPLFRRWVLQNFPFIEQDFDALTDYQLICKVVEYLNKVIDTTNTISEQVEYIVNWFNNLDVEEEVETVLKQMIEDGTIYQMLNYNPTTETLTLTFIQTGDN